MRTGIAPLDERTIDPAEMRDALRIAAARFHRLSDDEVRALRRRRRAGIAAAGGAMAAFAALLFVCPEVASPLSVEPIILATRPGERASATLSDGSTVRLDGATRVEMRYTRLGRDARLIGGQAFFDVRHDPSRPFTVHAGGGAARVLGTAFDLDVVRGDVRLLVYRGAVRLGTAATPGVVVRAGYRSTLRRAGPDAPVRFDAMLPDWRDGWIDADAMRLDALVDVLNRRGGRPIAVPGGQLGATMLFGRFRADRPVSLLGAIGGSFGFTVRDDGDRITLEPVD